MRLPKITTDRLVTVAAAVAAPVLTLLVDQRVFSAATATDVGAIVTAAVASYHGGAALQRRATAAADLAAADVAPPPAGFGVPAGAPAVPPID